MSDKQAIDTSDFTDGFSQSEMVDFGLWVAHSFGKTVRRPYIEDELLSYLRGEPCTDDQGY